MLEECVQLLVKSGLQPGQLGVITPYAAQVSLLSKRLQQRGYNINGSGGSGWDSFDGELAGGEIMRSKACGMFKFGGLLNEAIRPMQRHELYN